MTNPSTPKKYDLLSLKIGRESAKNLNTYIEYKIKEELENKTQLTVTREEFVRMKAVIVKWLFIFWIAQALSTFAIIILFLKK